MEQTNQNQFKCSGDCLNCRAVNDRRVQWQYCAAQFSYNALRTLQTMQEAFNLISGEIKELKDKVEAMQNSEATVFDPTENLGQNLGTNLGHDIAQEGDGAEE